MVPRYLLALSVPINIATHGDDDATPLRKPKEGSLGVACTTLVSVGRQRAPLGFIALKDYYSSKKMVLVRSSAVQLPASGMLGPCLPTAPFLLFQTSHGKRLGFS